MLRLETREPPARRGVEGLTIILYYSGRDGLAEPEVVLGGRGKKADLMLTFALSMKKDGTPTSRFANVLKYRKRKKGKRK